MTEAHSDGVVVYWRPGCPYCMRMRLMLRLTRLRFTEVNIWTDESAAALVRAAAGGNETVPTVTVAGHAMVNPTPRQVLKAAAQHSPTSLPD